MILLLLAACAFTVAVGDVADTLIIALVVVVNTATGVTQEVRADRAVAALAALAAPLAHVVRGGVRHDVPTAEVVPGDLLALVAGDVVPADATVVEAHDLEIDQSAMTGESLPVAAVPSDVVWGGTHVTAGRGTAEVTRTGAASAIGRVASLLASTRSRSTPLQRRLARLSRLLVLVVVVLTVVVIVQGLLVGRPATEMALVGVSLAVAAVPESLPAVIAVSLALGAHRMASRNALVRRLLAVEVLGSVTVIVTDKTGTLTEGRLVAERLWVPVPGPAGEARLVRAVALCNDAHVSTGGEVHGESLEVALVALARGRGLDVERLRDEWVRVGEEPFDVRTRLMRTRHRAPGGGGIVVEKGAPEAVLAGLGDLPDIPGARAEVERLAADGYRVIAVAEWPVGPDGQVGSGELVGLVGFVDPPRAEALEVVRACHRAGIRVILVTGDHPGTARAIAERVGIRDDPEHPGVHARVLPEEKVAIVEEMQAHGEVVAMLGDGVNDAPALRCADIGVAAGRGGTEVAREAADLILLDDDFRTVVVAVEEGRRIYTNIRTFLVYAVSGGLAEVGVMVIGPLLGFAAALLPAQILWINLLTHGPTGVAFGVDPADPAEMSVPPRSPDEPVLGRSMTIRLALACSLLVTVSLGAGLLFEGTDPRTSVFLCLGLGQLGVALAIRARPARGGHRNRGLLAALAVAGALMVAAVAVAPLRPLLGTEAVTIGQLAGVAVLAALPGGALAVLVRWERVRRSAHDGA
jgi:Ca2+-transporting ATPase